MMKKKRSIAIAAWCMMLPVALWVALLTDNTASAEKKKTILEHADLIEGGEKPGPSGTVIPYRSAIGNARFLHGRTILQCDRATDWPDSERIDLEGNIIIKEGTVETRSDRGVYHTDTEIGELSGNVRGRMPDDSLTVKAARGKIDQQRNELWLYDDAVAWQPGRQLSGDTIRVHLREIAGRKRADEIEVRGRAFLLMRDTLSTTPALYDQLAARTITAKLDNRSRLQKVTAKSKAKSLYHLYDEKKEPSGINFTSGETIRMEFIDGKLDRIRVTGTPLGKEYPNSMRNDKEINLPGYRLRDRDKPVF